MGSEQHLAEVWTLQQSLCFPELSAVHTVEKGWEVAPGSSQQVYMG